MTKSVTDWVTEPAILTKIAIYHFLQEKMGYLGTIMHSMIFQTFVTTYNIKQHYQLIKTITEQYFGHFSKFRFPYKKTTTKFWDFNKSSHIYVNLLIVPGHAKQRQTILWSNKVPIHWIVFEKTPLTECVPWQNVPRFPLQLLHCSASITELGQFFYHSMAHQMVFLGNREPDLDLS